jgi:LacI family transcriptional regulator
MSIQPRPTLRDIARRAGCHYSTVSLALRDHPRIAAETRARVQSVARQLGYQPDAMLAALSVYRQQKRPAASFATIAWLTNHARRQAWRDSACNVDYFNGATARGAERGYRLEQFWLAEPGMSARRLSDILHARGIQGLLLPPQERLCSIELDWDKFSAVTFGYTLLQPRLHLVSNHEYRTMGTLFAELQRREYRQIGLVDLREHDARVDHNWLAAYLIEQHRLAPGRQLAPLILERWDDARFLGWLREHRPDAIVTKLPEVLPCLERTGLRVPDDVGVAFHSLDEATRHLSGMKKNAWQLGVMAMDLVIDMIHRNERGLPALPHLSMVEGSWVEGRTVRPFAAAPMPSTAIVPLP